MKIISWSRKGWIANNATPEDYKQYNSLEKRFAYSEDLVKFKTNSEIDLYQEVQDSIQTKSAYSAIDELPDSFRDIYSQTDEWFLTGTKMFKVINPINQVYERFEWGTDIADADLDITKTTVTRQYLEDRGLLNIDKDLPEDILGTIGEKTNIKCYYTEHGDCSGCKETFCKLFNDEVNGINTPINRVDIDVERTSKAPDPYIPEEESLEEEVYTNEFEPDFEPNEEDYICPAPREANLLVELPDEVEEKVRILCKKYNDQITQVSSQIEKDKLSLILEGELDKLVSPYITSSLNSSYCARGYSQPGRRHDFIFYQKEYDSVIKSQDREDLFNELIAGAASCESKEDLFGHLEEIDGNLIRKGGFLEEIRDMYNHDKDIVMEWSLPNGSGESAFEIAREKFISDWREDKLKFTPKSKDEESLRSMLWFWFDRKASKVNAEYNNDGKLIKESKSYKDSIWRSKRAISLFELHLTRKHWDGIYSMVDIIKNRLKLNKRNTEDRDKVVGLLKRHFRNIENLGDLEDYKKWASKRHIKEIIVKERKTIKVFPSKLDRISFKDEEYWAKSVNAKKVALINKLIEMNKLENEIESITETNEPEIFVKCPHVIILERRSEPCRFMASGIPRQAKLKDGSTKLFVKCECGKKVWL